MWNTVTIITFIIKVFVHVGLYGGSHTCSKLFKSLWLSLVVWAFNQADWNVQGTKM